MQTLKNFEKFNKECICLCMNFIDTKMHGTKIKTRIVNFTHEVVVAVFYGRSSTCFMQLCLYVASN